MPGKVVDASVIAAMTFEEPGAEEAEALLDGSDLAAPSFLAYELTNVARKKALLYPQRLEDIERALREALRLEIQSIEVDHLAVLELALGTGLTTYDASYLYLARTLGLPLVTFDQQLLAAIRGPS